MLLCIEDTIAAIATPAGMSAVGIVRISGNRAFEIAQPLFGGRGKLSEFPSHTLHYGRVLDPACQNGASTNVTIDEALFLVMRHPRSYTGEDMVEIQSHGNAYTLQKILALLMREGARLARPGEFTRRAFLSGRIDLAQAEAVMEVIAAQNETHRLWALDQLRGTLSNTLHALRNPLTALLADVEAAIDFSEEGLSLRTTQQVQDRLKQIHTEVQALLASYETGRKIRDGSTVVIAGRPNVGKSCLMNRLLGENRAIVTPYPGTTRDLLQEWVRWDDLSLRIVDTAGCRKTEDPIEQEGVRRGQEALEHADLILWVMDATQPMDEEDRVWILRIRKKIEGVARMLVVFNKSDLPYQTPSPAAFPFPCPALYLSAQTGEGIEQLCQAIRAQTAVVQEKERPLVALLRHRDALARADQALNQAEMTILPFLSSQPQEGLPWECLAADLRVALDALDEIVGEITTDDILDQIFSRFCIGK